MQRKPTDGQVDCCKYSVGRWNEARLHVGICLASVWLGCRVVALQPIPIYYCFVAVNVPTHGPQNAVEKLTVPLMVPVFEL